MSPHEEWGLSLAGWPLFWCVTLIFTSLAIAVSLNRLNRWVAVSILVVPVCGAFQTGKDLGPDDAFNDIYLRFVVILASHMLYLCFQDITPGSWLDRKPGSKVDACVWGYKVVYNPRGVGTSWELPYLWPGQRSTVGLRKPGKSTEDRKGKNAPSKPQLPSRGKWAAIRIRFGYLLVNFLAICCYFDLLNPTEFLGVNEADYVSERASIIRRLAQHCTAALPTTPITKRELAVRINETVSNFLPDYLILSAYHDFFAIFFLATGVDQSWEWPPLFGQISEAYSMRRFWSSFWHKLIYRSFNSHAAVISRSLGIRERTVFSRLLNNYMVFLMSGVMHAAVLWRFGTKCAWSATMRYWSMQALAFFLEGVVQHYWGRFRKTRLMWVRPAVLSVFERLVGYLWVVAWLVWEAPRRNFTIINCEAQLVTR